MLKDTHAFAVKGTTVNRASLGLLLSALMLGGLNVSAQAQDSPTQSAQTQDTQVQGAQTSSSSDQQAAAQVLDLLNQYSSDADWDKYFALYRKDGILLGRMRVSVGEWRSLNITPALQKVGAMI